MEPGIYADAVFNRTDLTNIPIILFLIFILYHSDKDILYEYRNKRSSYKMEYLRVQSERTLPERQD